MREADFQIIRAAIQSSLVADYSMAMLAGGDSLAVLRQMPTHSVSLILTDPPYHITKKNNIVGDTAFKSDGEYLDWLSQYIEQWERVLRPNGSIFCFCAPEMASRIELLFYQRFNVLAQIVWTKPNDPGFDGWKQKMKKEALRQWYTHSERIIFAEPAREGNIFRSYFGNLLREKRQEAGLTMHQLTAMTGAHGAVNHGGAVSNWEAGRNIPSREQYAKVCEALLSTGKVDSMPPFEDVIRPFKTDASKEFTDIWTFPSVRPYKGKHPAEKPLQLLEHAIEATTWPGDVVLDCFAGSGNTALAALRLGRRAIAVELAPKWLQQIAYKLSFLEDHTYRIEGSTQWHILHESDGNGYLPLFSRSK